MRRMVGIAAPLVATRDRITAVEAVPKVVNLHATSITVTAHATAHTKGSWTEAFASTAADAHYVCIGSADVATANTDTRMLIDVGVGAAGSEVAVASNLPVGYATGLPGTRLGPNFFIPVFIPKGSRVAFRSQALISADTVRLYPALYASQIPGVAPPASSVDTIGASTTTSTSTITFSAANTYYELAAATAQPYRALSVHLTGTGNNLAQLLDNTVTVGVGAAGAEVATVTARFTSLTSEDIFQLPAALLASVWVGHVPKGSRIAVKSDQSGASAFGAIVIGVPYS